MAGADSNIRVVCRFRPLNSLEEKAGSKFIVKFSSNKSGCSLGGKLYNYAQVFKPIATQKVVYDEVAKQVVKDFLNGNNGTIFAYGLSSSGKTYTMEGVLSDPLEQGIIPRAVDEIFNYIYSLDENVEFHIKLSCFEIYKDEIWDLLDFSKRNLSIVEDQQKIPYVQSLTERLISSPEEAMEVFEDSKANRHTSVTNLNEHSSRSHGVFLITLRQENLENGAITAGKLYLVDLAGTSCSSKTVAEGIVLEELKSNNKSLSALSSVISALAKGRNSYVPYRSSKLTRILQDGLGGSSRTAMIVCCSPASIFEWETKSSLDFGLKAKAIKGTTVPNISRSTSVTVPPEDTESTSQLQDKTPTILPLSTSQLQGKTTPTIPPSSTSQLQDKTPTILPLRTSQLQGKPTPTIPPLSTSQVRLIPMIPPLSPSQPQHRTPTIPPLGGNDEVDRSQSCLTILPLKLDEKGEEINPNSKMIGKLKELLLDQEGLISTLRDSISHLTKEKIRLESENQRNKQEASEALQALEELAVNFEQKSLDADRHCNENERLSEDLQQKSKQLKDTEDELERIKQCSAQQDERSTEKFGVLFEDLGELGKPLNVELLKKGPEYSQAMSSVIHNDYIVVRLHIAKLKSGVQSLVGRCGQLEKLRSDDSIEMESLKRRLSECRLSVLQLESSDKIVSMHEDSLLKSTVQETDPLVTQINPPHLEVAMLRDEVTNQQGLIDLLKSRNEKLTLSYQFVLEDFQRIKKKEEMNSIALREFHVAEKKKSALQELNGFKEVVAQELHSLNQMRTQLEVSHEGEGMILKQKINLLEENLAQVNKSHRQVVRDNEELRSKLENGEKIRKLHGERLKTLQLELQEAKESSRRDSERYLSELDRVKKTVRPKRIQCFTKADNFS